LPTPACFSAVVCYSRIQHSLLACDTATISQDCVVVCCLMCGSSAVESTNLEVRVYCNSCGLSRDGDDFLAQFGA
jgi:hypothetical protein